MLEPRGAVSLAVIVAFAVLTFVPARYLYITRGGPFSTPMLAGGAIWAGITFLVVVGPAAERKTLARVSLIYPLTYLVLSWVVTFSTLKSQLSSHNPQTLNRRVDS